LRGVGQDLNAGIPDGLPDVVAAFIGTMVIHAVDFLDFWADAPKDAADVLADAVAGDHDGYHLRLPFLVMQRWPSLRRFDLQANRSDGGG
jgi:hypothetical protein